MASELDYSLLSEAVYGPGLPPGWTQIATSESLPGWRSDGFYAAASMPRQVGGDAIFVQAARAVQTYGARTVKLQASTAGPSKEAADKEFALPP